MFLISDTSVAPIYIIKPAVGLNNKAVATYSLKLKNPFIYGFSTVLGSNRIDCKL